MRCKPCNGQTVSVGLSASDSCVRLSCRKLRKKSVSMHQARQQGTNHLGDVLGFGCQDFEQGAAAHCLRYPAEVALDAASTPSAAASKRV
jgi:hypothetical protein